MKALNTLIFFVIIILLVLFAGASSYRTVQPGCMGVKITLGKAAPLPLGSGFYFVAPFISRIESVNVQVQSANFMAACFSSDLQTINANVTVIFRNRPEKVVDLYTKYQGDVLDSLLVPNTQEALKQVTALLTAENIVQQREEVKNKALDILRKKMDSYDVASIDDLVIVNIDLSSQLEEAIEAKMVQQQRAAQAVYAQDQAKVDAATVLIRAEGEAKALQARGDALKQSPQALLLNVVEKWDGRAPATLVLGGNMSIPSLLLNNAAADKAPPVSDAATPATPATPVSP
jgi:prohibitin 2